MFLQEVDEEMKQEPKKPEKVVIPGGIGWVQIGAWRFGETGHNTHGQDHFSFSKDQSTAVIFRSDGTIHPGPRKDWGLGNKQLESTGSNAVLGDNFLQIGFWRLAQIDQNHFSLSHKYGKTAMIWRKDGTQHPGPRTDFGGWQKLQNPNGVSVGGQFIQIGEWKLGVLMATICLFLTRTPKTLL